VFLNSIKSPNLISRVSFCASILSSASWESFSVLTVTLPWDYFHYSLATDPLFPGVKFFKTPNSTSWLYYFSICNRRYSDLAWGVSTSTGSGVTLAYTFLFGLGDSLNYEELSGRFSGSWKTFAPTFLFGLRDSLNYEELSDWSSGSWKTLVPPFFIGLFASFFLVSFGKYILYHTFCGRRPLNINNW